jgi:hypothetical protein
VAGLRHGSAVALAEFAATDAYRGFLAQTLAIPLFSVEFPLISAALLVHEQPVMAAASTPRKQVGRDSR